MPDTSSIPGLLEARSLWRATVALLDFAAAHSSDNPARHANDDRLDAWYELVGLTRDAFVGRESDAFTAEDLKTILAWTEQFGAKLGTDSFDAVAAGIDGGAHHTFCDSWAAEVGTAGFHRLTWGEAFPVSTPDPREFAKTSPPSSHPSALTPPKPVDELAHVRRHRSSRFDVVFDFTLGVELLAAIGTARRIGAGHPNEDDREFTFPMVSKSVMFDIGPVATEEQTQRLLRLTHAAIEEDVRVLVFPELAGQPAALDQLQALVDNAENAHLVVAGSYHQGSGPTACNTAVGVVSGGDKQLTHHKFVPIHLPATGEDPDATEGISQAAQPALVLYQAGQFRVSVLICKDLLDGDTEPNLARLGANVVLVPAMSPKTEGFVARAGSLVNDSQALTVVANGPLRWSKDVRRPTEATKPVAPTAIFGQPFGNANVVQASPFAADGAIVGRAPLLTIFEIGATEAMFRPI